MNTKRSLSVQSAAPVRRFPRSCQAFTIVELLVSVTLVSFVFIALVYTQLFGMKYDQLVNSKLGASDSARRGFDKLTMDIRAAKIWNIGNGNRTTFTNLANGATQVGNAINLNLSTDTNAWIRYYFDTDNVVDGHISPMLMRTTNGQGSATIMAQNLTNTVSGVTNSYTFHAEDYAGNLMSDYQFKYVIAVTLEFAQYQYPLTKVGPGYYFNYYRMQFRVASHNFN